MTTIHHFKLPPSEVREWHEDPKAGEFYGTVDSRKNGPTHKLGPENSKEAIDAALHALRINDDEVLKSVEIIDERDFWGNEALRKVRDEVRRLPIEDVELIFSRVLDDMRKGNG